MVETLRGFSEFVTIFETGVNCAGAWKTAFTAQGPLSVELGAGKGQFLREMARQFPGDRFVGLEKEPGVLVQAVRQVRDQGLQNLKFILGDVQDLSQMFGSGEVDGLYINFCDPWPKSRHCKRRLTHVSFLEQYRQVLSPSGVIRFKTDNRPLFDFSLQSFRSAGMVVSGISYDLHADTAGEPPVMTEYEAKFTAAGMPVHHCEARFGGPSEEAEPVG